MPTRTATTILFFFLFLAGCSGGADTPRERSDPGEPGAEQPGTAQESRTDAAAPEQRPGSVTDTLMIEGMPEPLALRLFRAPQDFPLPFSAYVPADMAPEASEDGDGASARFVAEFGGVRNERALVHLFVHPAGTDPQQALAVVRAYQAGTGVPVSQGLEPLGEAEATRRMPWAGSAFVLRYQAGGTWYLGSIGLGMRAGRPFHILVHYPAEHADGFAPRTDLIFETWRWADGSPLRPGSEDFAVPSARPDSLPPEAPTPED